MKGLSGRKYVTCVLFLFLLDLGFSCARRDFKEAPLRQIHSLVVHDVRMPPRKRLCCPEQYNETQRVEQLGINTKTWRAWKEIILTGHSVLLDEGHSFSQSTASQSAWI